jgi:hypothetical protein
MTALAGGHLAGPLARALIVRGVDPPMSARAGLIARGAIVSGPPTRTVPPGVSVNAC